MRWKQNEGSISEIAFIVLVVLLFLAGMGAVIHFANGAESEETTQNPSPAIGDTPSQVRLNEGNLIFDETGVTAGKRGNEGQAEPTTPTVRSFYRFYIPQENGQWGDGWEALDMLFYEEGMTWREWVNSPYNTIGAYIKEDEYFTYGYDWIQYVDSTLYGEPTYMDFTGVVLEDLTYYDGVPIDADGKIQSTGYGMFAKGIVETSSGNNSESGGGGFGGGGGRSW